MVGPRRRGGGSPHRRVAPPASLERHERRIRFQRSGTSPVAGQRSLFDLPTGDVPTCTIAVMADATPSSTPLSALPAREAVPELVERYGDKLYRLGRSVCRSEEEAADLLQDVFLTAFRRWDQFEGRSKPSTWLYTIAVRACRRRHRRRSGEPTKIPSFEDLLPSGADAIPDPDAAEGPLDDLLRQEIVERVDEAMASLPASYRMPLLLKELSGLSVQETAAVLGLEEATVKTRLHRGRLQLRKALAQALPVKESGPPSHDRALCLDLLAAKQEAMDRGVPFPVPPDDLCDRCRSLFATLDLAHEACAELGADRMPTDVRRLLDDRLREG